MIVYIEYVIVNNFVIDYLLLKSTFLIIGKKTKAVRLVFCALFASIFSLLFPLVNLPNLLLTALKLASGLLLLLLSAKFYSKKEISIAFMVFIGLTFLSGGGIYFIYYFLGININSELVIATICIPVYLVIVYVKKIINYIYKRKNIAQLTYQVEIEINNRKRKLNGFLDTGNNIYYKNSPVLVCEKSFAKWFIDEKSCKAIEKITINTANGKSDNYCMKIDKITISMIRKERTYTNLWLMFASVNIVGVELIIHPDLIKGDIEDGVSAKTKKVS